MKLSELGEKKVVSALTKGLYSKGFVTLPAGLDDAASIFHLGEEIVFTSDIMFSSSHFPPQMPPESMGWKSAIASISDLAGMGASPLAFLASFGLPSSLELEFVKLISKGINDACRAHGCPFAGGDTKKSEELTIAGSAIGACCSNAGLLKRSNARPGDVVCVTGNLGDAACGAQIMLGKTKKPVPPKTSSRLLKAFLKPVARVRLGTALSSLKARMAGMDVTDGLFYSASEVSKASGYGMRIESKAIPFSKEALWFAREQTGLSPVRLLEWGEDYELLVMMRRKDFTTARAAAKRAGGKLIQIGKVIKEKTVLLDDVKVDTRGYDAFLSRH